MTKIHRHSRNKRRKIRGGDFSSWWNNNVTNNSWLGNNSGSDYGTDGTGSGWFSRSKKYLSSLNPWSSSNNMSTNPQYGMDSQYGVNSQYSMDSQGTAQPQQYYGPSGGKRKTKRRVGGFSANTPTTGLAHNASPVSGLATAKAHNWVGGRTKNRRHKHTKTCRH